MNRLVFATASVLALVVANGVFASDIYKWIDEDGNVHYGDRPAGEQPVRVAVVSRPTDPARIQAAAQQRSESRAARAEAQAAAAAAGPRGAQHGGCNRATRTVRSIEHDLDAGEVAAR